MAKSTFETRLATFKKSIKTSMSAAKDCANMAIQHFADKNGDVTQLQLFFDAMPNNFIRKTAYVEWVCHFAPVVFDKGHFTKDKSDEAVEMDLAGALAITFWEWKQDAALAMLLNDDDAFKKAMAFVNFVRKDKVKASAGVMKLADGIEALVTDAQHAADEAIN